MVCFVTLSNEYCFHDILEDCALHLSIKLLMSTEGLKVIVINFVKG